MDLDKSLGASRRLPLGVCALGAAAVGCNDDVPFFFAPLSDIPTNSPRLISDLEEMSEELEAIGMLVFFVNAQDSFGRTSYTEDAADELRRYATLRHYLFAGDGDCSRPDCIIDSGLLEFFPSSFVIRRRDMALIADARDSATYRLPLLEIAEEPECDWSAP